MLAKAVANHTTASFITVVGSEFIQKYLREGPRMVHDVFRLVKEKAPAIIFMDKVDAIATAGFVAQTCVGQEVQRIVLRIRWQWLSSLLWVPRKMFCNPLMWKELPMIHSMGK
ncbi:UNVERIFIED_CONTAM: 26S proteasome regulatory subunitB [Sesamum latifolium]|uniref:26S proteasome regulatory subunitB n=1 Tax=Sesamum latifolium TaxID=2727402 RepID=A0AAW2U3P9_9LAMI